MSQAELADRAGIPRPHVSRIENRRTRVKLSKAIAIADTLGSDVDRLFVRLVTLSRAATDRGLGRGTLRAAVAAGVIRADRLEPKDGASRVYFIEENLDAQLEQLPACTADRCQEQALAPSGYCTAHKWKASHDKIRRAVARPIDERRWLTEDEVGQQTGRAWDVVHRAIVDGDFRAWRVGGCVISSKSDIAEWDMSLPPGRRSQAWQDETDGMVRLYFAGKSSTVIASRAGRKAETVLRRLRACGVEIRGGGISSELARELLLRAWRQGTGLARWQVENRAGPKIRRRRKLQWAPKPGRTRRDAHPEWEVTLERIRDLYARTQGTERQLVKDYTAEFGVAPWGAPISQRTVRIALERPV